MRLGNLQAKSSRVSNLPNRNFFFRVTSSVFQFSWNVNFYFTLVFFYFCFVCFFFWDGRDGLEVELKGFVCFLTSAIENSKARKDKGRKAIWFCNWLSTLVTRRRCLAQGVWRHKPLDTHVGSRANMTKNVKIIWGIFQKINHGDCQLKRLPPALLLNLLDWKKNGFAQQVVLRQYLDPLDQWQ